MAGITMDGIEYDVRAKYGSLSRSFSLLSGANAGTLITYREKRDLVGTGYTYEMEVEPNPLNPQGYDLFFAAISLPVETHTVIMPYGQTTMEFEAKIIDAKDIYSGYIAGKRRWTGLKVAFEYIQPPGMEANPTLTLWDGGEF